MTAWQQSSEFGCATTQKPETLWVAIYVPHIQKRETLIFRSLSMLTVACMLSSKQPKSDVSILQRQGWRPVTKCSKHGGSRILLSQSMARTECFWEQNKTKYPLSCNTHTDSQE